jgi:hypothetical protein
MKKLKNIKEKYLGFQTYFNDEWINTRHKTLKSLEKEARTFGNGTPLYKFTLGGSWFEDDVYCYTDSCGHNFLYRGITSFEKELLENTTKTQNLYGNSNVRMESYTIKKRRKKNEK